MDRFEKHPILLLTVGVIGNALAGIFVRYTDAPSLIIAQYRLTWTVILMLPVLIGKRKKYFMEIAQTDNRTLLLCCISGISLALHFTLWFESLNYTSVASSTAILCTEVLWVAIGFSFFPGRKVSKKAWHCMSITMIGSILIAAGDFSVSSNGLKGDLLALTAAIFAASFTLISRVARKDMTTVSYTFIVYVFCALALTIAVFISGMPFTGYGFDAITVSFLLSRFSTFLGFTIFTWCLKFLSPTFISSAKLCQTPIAALCAFVLFHEVPTPIAILGGIVVIAGVGLYSYQVIKVAKGIR